MNNRRRVVPATCLALCAVLGACDSSSNRPEPTSSAQSAAAHAPFLSGHIVARLDTPQGEREAHALLLPNGTFRMGMHGVGRDVFDAAGSIQLVGHLAVNGGQAAGSGVAIGVGCGLPMSNPFCEETASWQMTLDTVSSWVDHGAEGELVITRSSGQERWFVDTGYWGGQPSFGSSGGPVEGLYRERLAEFGQGGDVLLDVSADGRFFFQGAHNGCVGNGLVMTYGNLAGHVNAVELTIEGCAGASSHLNRRFEGLSVIEAWTPWDYWGGYHKMWLSTSSDGAPPAAMMLIAEWVE
jgi:hypothetical protein